MRRIAIISVLVILSAVSAHAQLREMVFIVEPNIHADTKEEFLEISDDWEKKSPEFSDWLRGISEGGHGSGFLYVDDEGDNYVVTNRHVVTFSDSADIKQRIGREEIVFKECPIVYVSDTTDIAVLAFPDYEKVFEKGLSISVDPVSDGDEAISAGYPGVNYTDEKLWQFAKGYITNSEAYSKALFGEDSQRLLQHSANIDNGSSGGPLLIETDGEYRVIGVNTYSLVDLGRENTFFSIPSEQLVEELNRGINIWHGRIDENEQEGLEKTCLALADQLNSEEPDVNFLNKLLSNQLVSDKGITNLDRILQARSDNEAREWWDFFISSPWDAMRYAVGEYEYEALIRLAPIRFIETVSEDYDQYRSNRGTPVRARYQDSKKTYEITWIFQFGNWRINEIETLSAKEAKALALAVPVLYAVEQKELERMEQEEKALEQEEKTLRKAQRTEVRMAGNDRYHNIVSLFVGVKNVTSSGSNAGITLGLGYWHRFPQRNIYTATNILVSSFTDGYIPPSDPEGSYFNDLGYCAHGTVGYTTMLTGRLRFSVGIGINVNYVRITFYDPAPVVTSEYSFGFGPTGEIGLRLDIGEHIVLGYDFSVDGIYFPGTNALDNTYFVIFPSLYLGAAW